MNVSSLGTGRFVFDCQNNHIFGCGQSAPCLDFRPARLDTWHTNKGRFAVKTCSKCGRCLPNSEFHKNPKTGDGLFGHCKKCCAIYQKAYRAKHKARLRRTKREYREKNREAVLARKREYAAANRERESARAIQWQKDNPDKVKKRSKLRRFRERANGGSVTWHHWRLLCFLFDNRCAACGEKCKLEMDHIISVADGGTGDIANLQPLCRSCNASKRTENTDYRTPFIKAWAERRQHENSE